MPPLSSLPVFVVAALALLLLPGPVVLYTVARSLHQGRHAGLLSALAVGLGDSCFVLATALGVAALLSSSPLAFSVVKYAGAAYLVLLGLRTLRAGPAHQAAGDERQSRHRVFSQGLIVSLSNPKTALFFVAFLPQFVDPTRGAATQLAALGSLYVGLGLCTNSMYALVAGGLRGALGENARFRRAQRFIAAGAYLALGVTAALTGAPGGPT